MSTARNSPGSEAYRGGTRTSARGLVTGKAAKKAIEGMLETNVAELNSGGPVSQPKAKAKSKASAKAGAKAKLTSPEEKQKKDLLKDIKAFFSCNMKSTLKLCWGGCSNHLHVFYIYLLCIVKIFEVSGISVHIYKQIQTDYHTLIDKDIER